MSYCRWSSMDFACDLYAYESVEYCFVIHVASSRVVGDVPKTPPFPSADASPEERDLWARDYTKAIRVQSQYLNDAEHVAIGLPFDGQTIRCADLSSFKEQMLELRRLGYKFPDYALTAIDEELAEASP